MAVVCAPLLDMAGRCSDRSGAPCLRNPNRRPPLPPPKLRYRLRLPAAWDEASSSSAEPSSSAVACPACCVILSSCSFSWTCVFIMAENCSVKSSSSLFLFAFSVSTSSSAMLDGVGLRVCRGREPRAARVWSSTGGGSQAVGTSLQVYLVTLLLLIGKPTSAPARRPGARGAPLRFYWSQVKGCYLVPVVVVV